MIGLNSVRSLEKEYWIKVLGFAVLYSLLGRAGILTSIPPGIASAIWPAAGVGLGAILLLGYRAWPGVFLGAVASDLPALIHCGLAKSSWAPLGSALGMAGAATVHALLGGYLIRKRVKGTSPFLKTADIFYFLIAEIIATAASASIGTSFLIAGGFRSISPPLETWLAWATGDLVGAILITPLVFVIARPEEKPQWSGRRKLEGLALAVAFLLACTFVFGFPNNEFPRFPHFFILTPFFLWAAFRFSAWGVLGASVVMTGFTVLCTRYPGLSPFAPSGPHRALLFSQVAVAIHILVGLIVAAEAFQRRKKEEELSISAVEFVSDVVANVDLTGKLIWSNPAFDLITGFKREKWVGNRVARLVNQEDLPKVIHEIRRLVRGETNLVVVEFRMRTRKGAYSVLESTVKLTKKSEIAGGKASLSVVSRDITLLKRARAELEREVEVRTSKLCETERRLSAIFEQSPCGIAQVDLTGRFIFVTDRFCQITGWSREQLLERRAHDLTHPEDLALNVKEFESCILKGTPYSIEKRYVRSDGQTVWVNNTVSALHDAEGRPTSVVAVCEDLTSIKRAQAEVREKEDRFRSIADTSPILMCTSDERGKVFFNKAWCDFLGRTTAPESRESWVQGIHPADAEASLAIYRQAVKGRTTYQMEYRLRRRAGEYRWILECGTPRYLPDGSYLGLMGTALDFTDRKLAEIERQRAIEALESRSAELARSNDELARFAYVASHDLKEPLRVISTQLQLLEKLHQGKLDPRDRQCIQFAVEGSNRMYALVDDLLAFSKVGMTAPSQRSRETDLNGVLEEVIGNLKVAISDSGAVISVEPLPKVLADRIEATQVFQNLLNNGIKYRRDEPLKITVGSLPAKDGVHCLFVRDNGIGIQERYFDKVFILFQRLHTAEDYPGTGIGLAVCKKIVEQAGGKIWIESVPGKGSTFYFTLPGVACGTLVPLRLPNQLKGHLAVTSPG